LYDGLSFFVEDACRVGDVSSNCPPNGVVCRFGSQQNVHLDHPARLRCPTGSLLVMQRAVKREVPDMPKPKPWERIAIVILDRDFPFDLIFANLNL
jgi:hypothetical protein